jgi:NAD(P)-dependent dehydrogenase (short-subunit alcohol dehydrogenase family)
MEREMNYLEQMFGMQGRTVAITGGGGVIARAMGDALLRAGANVSLWDIHGGCMEEAKEALDETTGQGGRIYCCVVDALSEKSVSDAVTQTVKDAGGLDVLINTAGGNRGKTSFLETDMAQFELVLKLNLVAGLMVPTKIVAGYWVKNGVKGSIINMASMGSYVPLSGVWGYDAAKAGVLNLTMATAKEFAPHGIRVNALAPGFFLGKQNKALLVDEATGKLTARGEEVVKRTPFGRFGATEELCGAVMYLSSNAASGFVTGTCLPVDGGFLVDCI